MNLKREAARSLGAYLVAEIPILTGKVFSVQPDEEDTAKFPGLYVLPQSFEFHPFIEDIVDAPIGEQNTLARVGCWEGTIELRIASKALCGPAGRETLEQKILDAFMRREGAPGVIVTEVANLEANVVPPATPGAPTVSNQGTPGATTYSYRLVAKGNGGSSAAGTAGSTPTGNATLSVSNFNRLTVSAGPNQGYDVYRVAGGGSTGKIGSISPDDTTFDDTGLAGDSASLPTEATDTVTTTYAAVCAFTLENEDWREELVFSKKRFSFLEIGASFDAYVLRAPRYDIDSLVSAITEDMDTEDTPTDYEQVEVADDGTITSA